MNYLKHFLLFALLISCSGLIAQMSADEQAIKQAIEDETRLFYQRDYEGWAATWAHTDNAYASVAGPEYHLQAYGWEEVSDHVKSYFEENPEASETLPEKSDYKFSVGKDMAYVTFKEDGNMSSRVLKKKDEGWKIVRMDVVQSTAYQMHSEKKALEGLAGVWHLDPTTVELSDGDEWTLLDLKCKVKTTDNGIKMYVSSDWKGANDFKGTWKDEYLVARDSQAGKYGVMVSTTSPYGSSVFSGKCHFGDDYLAFKANQIGTENMMKHKIARVDDNSLKMHYWFKNEEGEVEWEMSFVVVKDPDESLASR